MLRVNFQNSFCQTQSKNRTPHSGASLVRLDAFASLGTCCQFWFHISRLHFPFFGNFETVRLKMFGGGNFGGGFCSIKVAEKGLKVVSALESKEFMKFSRR